MADNENRLVLSWRTIIIYNIIADTIIRVRTSFERYRIKFNSIKTREKSNTPF